MTKPGYPVPPPKAPSAFATAVLLLLLIGSISVIVAVVDEREPLDPRQTTVPSVTPSATPTVTQSGAPK